ncbi:MAG: tRNA guanosine(34) transglycosylase Tgt [Dehalococcoidia bacterium]|nr:tRNA guanosine(34) transglycosylase Tgt [Dehalococcoidia bacterium]
MLTFRLEKTSGTARAGLMATGHGDVPTPAFMPVGTQATVKALSPGDLRDIGARIILSNTYHLSLRPGAELIQRHGGLHRFMRWDGPLLTDSGGFQVFSLGHMRKLTDDGVTFRSHLDGSEHTFTPERAVLLQEQLGSDIAMAFDHCPAYGEPEAKVREATERTHRWAERCLRAQASKDQALFGIVQGGWSAELRRFSAETIAGMGFPGIAIGGVSVGEPRALAYAAVEHTVPFLPSDRPRYLMGVGSPEDLVRNIAAGIDLFDCALPTRAARNGSLFTRTGRVNLRNAAFRDADRPFDPACDCSTCHGYSAAYLHHLLRADELLYYRLATIHNLRFILRLMEDARAAIIGETFPTFAEGFLTGYRSTDEETRLVQKERWLERRRERGEPNDT